MVFGTLIGTRFLHQRCHHLSSLEQDKLTVCCLLQTGSQEPSKGHLQSGQLKELMDRLLKRGGPVCRDQTGDSSLHPSALQGHRGRAGKEGHFQRSNILWPQDMASSQPDREGRSRSVSTDVPLPCPLLSSRGFLWLRPARSQGQLGNTHTVSTGVFFCGRMEPTDPSVLLRYG